MILLSIQPASNDVRETLSSAVLQAVGEVAESLEQAILTYLSPGTPA